MQKIIKLHLLKKIKNGGSKNKKIFNHFKFKIMKKTILSLFVSMASLLCFAQNEIENLYHGKIANKYAITMNLIFKGNKVSGTYQYDKYAKDIEITGTIDAKKNIKLDEFDVKTGKQTGKFVGVLSKKLNEFDEEMQIIKGTFTNVKTGKKSTFLVSEAQD